MIIQRDNLSKIGGAEKYTWRLVNAFAKKGPLTLLTSNSSLPSTRDYTVINYKKSHLLRHRRIEGFDQFCRRTVVEKNSSIVFGMGRTSLQTHLRASDGVHAAYLERRARVEGKLRALSFTISPFHHTILEIEKCAYESKELRRLYTNSEMVKQEIIRYYKTDPAKICVVHNGIEWHEKEDAFELSFEKKREEYQFLFIGNGYKRKGLELLLRALHLLPESNFFLSVLGKDREIGYFQTLTKKLKLDKKVHFFGQVSDPTPFYQHADTLVIPSLYDPFANVTLEALAMGLFVISSPFNGGSEILTHNTGLIIENLFDLDAIKASLQQALRRPKTFSSALSIRRSIQHLDFSNQLKIITDDVLNGIS